MKDTPRGLMHDTVTTAQRLSEMTENIARHANQGAQNAEAQNQATTAMAASIEEMTSSINHIAERARCSPIRNNPVRKRNKGPR